MLRLETLGALVIAGDSGTPLPLQRRRLALLALLAGAGKRGLTRDKIVAILWPDTTEAKARHALEQLIYSLRKEQGEALVAGPDPLRINHHVLAVDVMEFLNALERGELAEAVRLYKGTFADGFYLSGAPEFESWMETERGRLAGLYRSALERLARQQQDGGQVDAAVESWRKLVAVDPLSTTAMLGLLRSLTVRGDRAAALQLGRGYAELVRREQTRGPDPAISALLKELEG
jgi:serine/threonine-protein kinase